MKTAFRKSNLKDHAIKIGSGVTPRGGQAVYKQNGIPLIRSQNVLNNRLDLSDVAYIDDAQHTKMKSSQVCPFDVLLNITGASIGRSCVVPLNLKDANVNQHVCIIRLKKSYDHYFLSSFLNSFYGQKQIQSFQGGGSREGLNYAQIGSFKIPEIPISEQKAIADTISTWDQAIEKTEKLIELKQKRFNWAANALILGQNNKEDRKLIKLGEILKESRIPDVNMNPSKRLSVRLHLKGVEIRGFNGSESEKGTTYYIRKAGQLIYGKQNIFRGAIGIVPLELDGYSSSQDIPAFDVSDKVDIEWLYFNLSNKNFYRKLESLSIGSGSKRLHPRELYKIKIRVPQMDLQVAITNKISLYKKEIEVLKETSKNYKFQKQGLMQKLLTGKWRVKL